MYFANLIRPKIRSNFQETLNFFLTRIEESHGFNCFIRVLFQSVWDINLCLNSNIKKGITV